MEFKGFLRLTKSKILYYIDYALGRFKRYAIHITQTCNTPKDLNSQVLLVVDAILNSNIFLLNLKIQKPSPFHWYRGSCLVMKKIGIRPFTEADTDFSKMSTKN